MELGLPHTLHLFIIFSENDGKENCAQVLEEEVNKILGIKSLSGEHDCNVASMLAMNIHDANDMQSHKLGDAMFDEDNFLVPQVLLRNFMMMKYAPIYDDYIDINSR